MRKSLKGLVGSPTFMSEFHQSYNQYEANERDAGNTKIIPRAKAFEEYLLNYIQTNPSAIDPDVFWDRTIG